jgi:hypothetical protein
MRGEYTGKSFFDFSLPKGVIGPPDPTKVTASDVSFKVKLILCLLFLSLVILLRLVGEAEL